VKLTTPPIADVQNAWNYTSIPPMPSYIAQGQLDLAYVFYLLSLEAPLGVLPVDSEPAEKKSVSKKKTEVEHSIIMIHGK